MRIRNLIALLFIAGLTCTAALAEPVFIRSAHALDDARGYCIDVAGFGILTDPVFDRSLYHVMWRKIQDGCPAVSAEPPSFTPLPATQAAARRAS